MSREMREIRVQHWEVFSRVAMLQAELRASLQEMEAEYDQIQSMLTEVDGATAAAFMSAMENNKLKAKVTAETLNKLLSFLTNSTDFVMRQDRRIGSSFNQNHGAGGLG